MMKIFFKLTTVVLLLLCCLSCDDSNETVTLTTENFTIEAPVVVRKLDTLGFLRGVSNAGEVTFSLRAQTPENSVTLGLRYGEIIVSTPENFNIDGTDEINLEVEVKKSGLTEISNVTILRNLNDPDGDGVITANDSEPNNPCIPVQDADYNGFNPFNAIWGAADCDEDGISNVDEANAGTNPYVNESLIGDADGDGVRDDLDPEPNDPCVPEQFQGYQDFNPNNEIWAMGDCDEDGVSNADELANGDSPYPQPNLPCPQILNFELENYERELRTEDSNNGEGVTVGVIGEGCGTFFFTGGTIFNQGCFNDDVSIPFIFTPSGSDSSSGTVSVSPTTYSCLSEDGTSTREFTVEGVGTYNGALSTVELTYTITQLGDDVQEDERVSTGTLIIKPLG